MLSDLAESFPVIRSAFQEASDVIGEDLWEVIQIDSKGILFKNRDYAAGATHSISGDMAGMTSLTNVKPNVLAGHSLGEYSALVCSDALSFDEAVSLVHFRGRVMQNAVPKGRGKMAAILGSQKLESKSFVRRLRNRVV